MKKLMLTVAVIATIFTGCSTKSEFASVAPSQYALEFEGAPLWVTDNANINQVVGSAKIGPAGVQFAETEATGIARDSMARQIETKVSNMLKNFTQQTGVGSSAVVDKVTADVSKQLSQQDLVGSKVVKKWISKTGTMWVLLEVNKDSIQAKLDNSVKSSFKNDDALWQQFQAKKAQDELDASLTKTK